MTSRESMRRWIELLERESGHRATWRFALDISDDGQRPELSASRSRPEIRRRYGTAFLKSSEIPKISITFLLEHADRNFDFSVHYGIIPEKSMKP
jgi:hypothetical protein